MMSEITERMDLVASSSLDALGGRERLDAMEAVMELALDSPESLTVFASLEAPDCRSVSSSGRVLQIYTKVMASVNKDNKSVRESLCEMLCKTWKQAKILGATKDVVSDSICSEYQEELLSLATPASLTLGFRASPSDRSKWIDGFVKAMFGSVIAPKEDMVLCEDFISNITISDWESSIGPIVEKKCKASPDKALDSVKVFLSYLSINIVAGDGDEFVPFLLKQLKLAKNRPVACDILNILGVHEITSSDERADIVVASNLVNNGLPSLIQADQRKVVYDVLIAIGRCAAASKKTITNDFEAMLQGLTTAVTKEKGEAREFGIKALTWWMVVTRRKGAALPDAVLSFFRKSIESGTDFLPRVGTIVTTLSSHQNENQDIMESILLLVLSGGAKVEQGLPPIFEKASSSKKTVAATEGLLALYLSILHSSSSSAGGKLALSFDKVCKSSKSFLYHVFEGKQPPLVQYLLPRTISLYVKYRMKKDENAASLLINNDKKPTSIARTVAQSLVHFSNYSQGANLDLIQTYDSSSSVLMTEMFRTINQTCCSIEKYRAERRDAEIESPDLPFVKIHDNHIRSLSWKFSASTSATAIAVTWILMHYGTTRRTNKRQRRQLMKHMMLSNLTDDVLSEISVVLSRVACGISDEDGDDDAFVCQDLHGAALSVLTTLGMVAGTFDEDEDGDGDDDNSIEIAHRLTTDLIPHQLQTHLENNRKSADGLSEFQLNLSQTIMGTLYVMEDEKEKEPSTEKVNKGRLTEEEEWELQMKKELATKESKDDKKFAPEQMEEIKEQDKERLKLDHLLEKRYPQTLDAIRALFLSDIEIGNACLPLIGPTVLNATIDAVNSRMFSPLSRLPLRKTLEALASCVYEMDEQFASDLCQSLLWSCGRAIDSSKSCTQQQQFSSGGWMIRALPSNCSAAAKVMTEITDYGDVLSPESFAFVLPLVCAILTGPRTPFPEGAESALMLLESHASNDENICNTWRRDMASAVLEFLKHDRSQSVTTFPTALETLVACYTQVEDGAISTASLAPLMDYAIYPGKHCRLGCMMAITALAQTEAVNKKNPLVENRVWVNCFVDEEEVRDEARKAWRILTASSDEKKLDPPSILYAIPLLPLLSNEDSAIAQAAAAANASAMALHTCQMMERNVTKLCSTYLENYPTEEEKGQKKSSEMSKTPALKASTTSKANLAPAKPKKSTADLTKGLRKTGKKKTDALSLMGKPKTGKKSTGTRKLKSVNKALLKPKEERTLDHDELANQFKAPSSTKNEKIKNDSPEKIRIRHGMLNAIMALTQVKQPVEMDLKTLKLVTVFLIAFGLADISDDVRAKARNALGQIIASFGNSDEAIAFLLPTLEHALHNGMASPSDADVLQSANKGDKAAVISEFSTAINRRKEGAVVALGSVALHLKGEENFSKIDSTVDMLLSTLHTSESNDAGNESVQASVADCLVKLMKKGNTPQRLEKPILEDLMRSCLYGEYYSQRRGASHGIAAVMKGSGIASLKKYSVVSKLQDAATNTGSTNSKEGSLFAMELLSVRLGLLFEPYVIVLLPSLLQCFSDTSDRVRAAAAHTADVIMSKLSAHGVKLVLPAILEAFIDPAWRTKQASIQMLGSMSHLAPKQLAGALPKVVPKLTEAFSDTHPKVKASAEHALTEITRVIRNPEISSISSTLLLALTDPSEGTLPALEALIQTEFLHAMDAPSLALIVPVLHRGLRDRIATTKRYAALIAGNICSMIHDAKDFIPYLPLLLPDLQLALLDPIPDVRSTSAKALGSLSRGLGAHSGSKNDSSLVDNLRPWLIEKLRQEDITSAERSGAAQGLTEVLVASSTTVERIMLEELLPLKSHPSASTREGVLWVLTFLPSALTGSNFTTVLLESSLPALLNGLSDENEPVRDVAMRAGRVLIRTHGKANVDTILPRLEMGLVSDDYRIRLASLTLLGDLLSLIGGTSVQSSATPQEMAASSTQDEFRKAERAQAQLALELGPKTRKSVLSSLYLARSDTQAVVRQMAVQVWKTVVAVTARTLRDILPSLTTQILKALASGHLEQTQVAGKCLGDVVQKLGDGILPELLPLLQKAILEEKDEDAATIRRGVCVGLSEVISHASREAISNYLELLTRVVRDALCDSEDSVRDMAASCFQSLHQVVGQAALDEMVPSLLIDLDSSSEEQSERAMRGLAGILKLRSRELLPYIIPRLLSSKPITISHANALSGIAQVTGATLNAHFHNIIPAVITSLSMLDAESDEEQATVLRVCARSITNNTESVNELISEIASKCGNDKAEIRKESCWMFQILVEERKDRTDFFEQIPIMLRELLYRLNDDVTMVLKANHAAWTALTKHVPAEELVTHIEYMQNLMASMVSEARRRKGGVGDGEFLMPGFNIPKGLEPLLPIYQRGILYGTPVIREVAAAGLGECISLTASKFLAGPLIIKMTGPLLRIVGDRNPSNVKVAILRTLGLILVKGGPALRAFVPQFQTTFVKALQDQSRQVRLEAIAALGLLMPLSTRIDPLLKELVAGSVGRSGEQIAAVQTATLEALSVVLTKGGGKAKQPDSVPSALSASQELVFQHSDEGVREAAAKVMGAACAILGEETTSDVLHQVIDTSGENDDSNADVRHGKACACHRILAASVGSKVNLEISEALHKQITELVVDYTKDDKASVKEAACVALGATVGSSLDPESCLRRVESVFITIMQSPQERMEVHKAVASGLCVALELFPSNDSVTFFGKNILDACLKLAMSGTQRVQYAFNDVLWLALGCGNADGGEGGLEIYLEQANFDNSKAMKAIHSKVLKRIQKVEVDL